MDYPQRTPSDDMRTMQIDGARRAAADILRARQLEAPESVIQAAADRFVSENEDSIIRGCWGYWKF